MLLRRAIERGLTAADFENMTIGMILDYLTTCNNEDIEMENRKKRGATRYASQADYDAF